jgi:hypothetical protein
MATEAIEEQLAAFGVKHSRERFVMLASDRFPMRATACR